MERMNSDSSTTSNSSFRRFTFRGKKDKPRDEVRAPKLAASVTISTIPNEIETLRPRSVSSGDQGSLADDIPSQLQKTITKLRSNSKQSVDDAFNTYYECRVPIELCTSFLHGSFDNRIDVAQPASSSESQRIELIHGYLAVQETLLENLRDSLLKTYQIYEPKVARSQIEALFEDRVFRDGAVQRMRSASMHKIISESPLFWEHYKIRFRNYEKLKKDASEIKRLFQPLRPGPATNPAAIDIKIAEKGDIILEFNTKGPAHPVYRFRVSSYILCEVSPLFAQMLSNVASNNMPDLTSVPATNADEKLPDLPSRPTSEILGDGSSVKVFHMPQIELNKHRSLTTVLQAAHLHHAQVPREISFPEFVSIAEVCLKYNCTSPVEVYVEYSWLPKWGVKAADEIPDGLLLICYVFGLRRLFERLSKSAILNIKDENDLGSNLPVQVREKIIAVRKAKLAQVQNCCMTAISEFLGKPMRDPMCHISDGSLQFTSVPRCPKGDFACDYQNLGWLMMIFNELGVLPPAINPNNPRELPRGSLKDLFNELRLVNGSPAPHGGVCDCAPAFRSAVNDIYNSIKGLTLKDISGIEGWSLSRFSNIHPPNVESISLSTNEPPDVVLGTTYQRKPAAAVDADIVLRILSHCDSFNDLRSAAMVDKSFHTAYKNNKVFLMEGLLWKAERPTTLSRNNEDIQTLRRSLRQELNIPPNPDIPMLEGVGDKSTSSTSDFSTPQFNSEAGMEQTLQPETSAMSDPSFKNMGNRFSRSSLNSSSDVASMGSSDEIRNEKYLLESKDDLKVVVRVEDKYLREESDQRMGIGLRNQWL